ncbi:glycoside hydrolase family 113 [Gilvibacter sediminis]|uniref:glycoside hydrolase family 113 n=1 Tax=Gilvibacter sediminis TaxID=379071 RepID=UPI00234FBAB9|nr:glycoside hydrolase [Gilvibacter sediminis]MDC7997353.1 glycoside hydrolase [Gilvibacter sediminis]
MKATLKIFIVGLLGAVTWSCAQQQKQLINGVSYVAARNPTDNTEVQHVLNVNANFAAVMPFGFIRSLDNPNIIHNTERQWFGETREGATQYIKVLKENGIKVMVKPQIWIWRGEFTGYMKMNSEADWKTLEASYSAFILEYAQMAADTQAEMFCIGTELEQFIVNRPEYWSSLIQQIKTIYKGELTYAANWDEYKRVPFWSELDYIGVDAYFPVADSKTPSVEEAKAGWLPWKQELASVSAREERPIIFTEYGYRSTDFSGKEPWDSDHTKTVVNLEAQTNTTQALFESVWSEPWFAGGFIWKWFTFDERIDGETDSQFTPQNKPVEKIIQQQYGKQ